MVAAKTHLAIMMQRIMFLYLEFLYRTNMDPESTIPFSERVAVSWFYVGSESVC
jgi:hypothetical protein